MNKNRVDTMTKEVFVRSWVETGMPPEDSYMNALTRNGGYRPPPVKPELRTEAVAERMWKIREDRKRLVVILRHPHEIAECLEEFNAWRRGQGKYAEPGVEPPYSAYMVGKLIEGAINKLDGSETEVEL